MSAMNRQSSWEAKKDNLRKFSGQVLHVVKDNKIFRYRVDDSGRILHEQLEKARGVAQRSWRKVVTGDPEKKVRDYMTEVPQVKLIDKLSFTFGVASMIIIEFLALRHPTYFTPFYYFLMSCLVGNRYFQYREENSEFFMLDFCYFMNLSVIVQTAFFPNSLMWYKANYVLCMGCLMLAILVWQNSLVFHSLDKLTSFFLHAFPPLTLHLYRWQLIPSEAIKLDDVLTFNEVVFWPMILYSVWQGIYLFLTEVVWADRLQRDPDLITSHRYLIKDKKNGMNKLVRKVTIALGIIEKTEEFTDGPKSKILFMLSQLLYTLVTLVFTPILYTNYTFSFVYIVGIYMWCVWRGGSYYIEVFSERYKFKFLKTDDFTHETSSSEHFEEGLEDPELFNQIYSVLKEADGTNGGVSSSISSFTEGSSISSSFSAMSSKTTISSSSTVTKRTSSRIQEPSQETKQPQTDSD